MPYNKSFVDQASSVKMAGYWPRSLFAFLWTSTSSLPCLKNILMEKWHLIQNEPLLRKIYKDPRLETCLFKQNYKGFYQHNEHTAGIAQVCQPHFTYLHRCQLVGRGWLEISCSA